MPGTDKTLRDRRGKSGEGAIPASRDGEKAALSVLDGYSQYLSRPYAALQLSQPPTSDCARYALPEQSSASAAPSYSPSPDLVDNVQLICSQRRVLTRNTVEQQETKSN